MRDDDIDINRYRETLVRAGLSKDDQDWLVSLMWSQQELGSVKSQKEYDAYGKMCQALEEQLLEKGVKVGGSTTEWSRTQEGKLLIAIGALMIEWEERHT